MKKTSVVVFFGKKQIVGGNSNEFVDQYKAGQAGSKESPNWEIRQVL
jgi:hypothetical protein